MSVLNSLARRRIVLLLGLCISLSNHDVDAQAIPSTDVSADRALYHLFFHYALHLQGTDQEPASKDSSRVTLLLKRLAVSPENAQIILTEAQKCEDEIKPVDASARSLILKARADAKATSHPIVFPEELIALQNTRNSIIDGHIARLRNSLTPDAYSDFNIHLHKQFKTTVRVTHPPTRAILGNDVSTISKQ